MSNFSSKKFLWKFEIFDPPGNQIVKFEKKKKIREKLDI